MKCSCGKEFTATGYNFGNRVLWCPDCFEWFYDNGDENTCDNYQKLICPVCKLSPTEKGHDPCIADLPGVRYACCGHGDIDHAYIMFDNDSIIRESEALEYFKNNK